MEQTNIEIEEVQQTYIQRNSRVYDVVKRSIDLILSLIALILFSPIFIAISIAIKIDSKGDIIFGHERIGKNGRKIKIYKFRTMVSNSKEVFESFTEEQKKEYYENFKLENDPRITKVGNFLRKTSLDELPQLLNILKGEMSIVGPRPIVSKEIEKYGVYFEMVFSIIPGLTGYWQANGRSDTTYQERVEMDMYYVNNRSLLLDVKILFRTVISVLKKEGAI